MVKKLVSLLLLMLCFSAVVMAADKKFTLVIDAGHGGKDSGAVGANSKEKNINLSVALAFGRYVEQNCPQVRVIYTRKTDVFIELQERANIANRNKADLFISVHTNSVSGSKTVKGFETYTLGMHRAADNLAVAKRENSVITMESDYQSKYQGFDPNSSESYIMFEYMQDKNMQNSVNLAKLIQKNVCKSASRVDKGIYQAGFLVLRQTSMPSCLVELGFISTPEEERQLNDPIIQDLYARGLYQAFEQYVNKYGNGIKLADLAPMTETQLEAVKEAESAVDTSASDSKNSEETKEEKRTETKKEKKAEVKQEKKAEDKTEVKQEKKTEAKKETKQTSTETKSTTKQETKKTSDSAKKSDDTAKKSSDTTKKTSETAKKSTDTTADAPVFKVQILTSSNKLKAGDSHFQGLSNVGNYKEGNTYKYTYGSSTNYNEIATLRKSILDKFPQAFIVAFKNGEKMNVNEAIKEWKSKRK